MYDLSEIIGFKELESWANGLPVQVDGLPSSVSETGEPYVVFYIACAARKGDEKILERYMSNNMRMMLDHYFNYPSREGKIYWRTRLEFDTQPEPQIIKFDENGPDIDFITDKRCVMDHDWVGVRIYCRVLKSDKPVLFPKEQEDG